MACRIAIRTDLKGPPNIMSKPLDSKVTMSRPFFRKTHTQCVCQMARGNGQRTWMKELARVVFIEERASVARISRCLERKLKRSQRVRKKRKWASLSFMIGTMIRLWRKALEVGLHTVRQQLLHQQVKNFPLLTYKVVTEKCKTKNRNRRLAVN